jgi:hypothetical protein
MRSNNNKDGIKIRGDTQIEREREREKERDRDRERAWLDLTKEITVVD